MKPVLPSPSQIHAQDVLAYLRTHPAFLREHPEIVQWLEIPEAQRGETILDFQHYAIAALKARVKEAEQSVSSVVHGNHARHSLQASVHQAALSLMKARTLEQFLECICLDFVSLFQVDVIRLVLESDVLGVMESYYPEQHYSGLAFLATGSCGELFSPDQQVRMVADSALDHPWLAEIVFQECSELATSVALLSLSLPMADRMGLLALGVRETGRFQDGQGAESFKFLAAACAIRLDQLLYDQAGLL